MLLQTGNDDFLGAYHIPCTDRVNLQCRYLQTSHWKNRKREPALWWTHQEGYGSPRLFIHHLSQLVSPSRMSWCQSRGLLTFGLAGLVSEDLSGEEAYFGTSDMVTPHSRAWYRCAPGRTRKTTSGSQTRWASRALAHFYTQLCSMLL